MSAKEFVNIFIKNVCWRREEAGLSIAELAERSGVPLEMLEELERGTIPEEMMVDDAFALAKVFGCRVCELF